MFHLIAFNFDFLYDFTVTYIHTYIRMKILNILCKTRLTKYSVHNIEYLHVYGILNFHSTTKSLLTFMRTTFGVEHIRAEPHTHVIYYIWKSHVKLDLTQSINFGAREYTHIVHTHEYECFYRDRPILTLSPRHARHPHTGVVDYLI